LFHNCQDQYALNTLKKSSVTDQYLDIYLTEFCSTAEQTWTRSCAACSRWPCFSRWVGL